MSALFKTLEVFVDRMENEEEREKNQEALPRNGPDIKETDLSSLKATLIGLVEQEHPKNKGESYTRLEENFDQS